MAITNLVIADWWATLLNAACLDLGEERVMSALSPPLLFLIHHILLLHWFGATEQRLGTAPVFAVGFFTSLNTHHSKCKVKQTVQHRQELFKHWEIRKEYRNYTLLSSSVGNGLLRLLLKVRLSPGSTFHVCKCNQIHFSAWLKERNSSNNLLYSLLLRSLTFSAFQESTIGNGAFQLWELKTFLI